MTVYNRNYNSGPMGIQDSGTAVADLFARMFAIKQQKEQAELDRQEQERRDRLAAQAEEDRQLRNEQTRREIQDADFKRAKEAAALEDSVTKRMEKQRTEAFTDIAVPETSDKLGAMKISPEAEAELTLEDRAAGMGEPTAEDSAAEVTTVPRYDVPAFETEKEVVEQKPQKFFDFGGEVGKVPLLYRDQAQDQAEEDALRRGDLIDTNRPEFQEAIADLPPAAKALVMLGATPKGYIPKTNMSGAMSAAFRGTTERTENPEPVVIDGVDTLATPSEIADAKKQGKSVRVYKAPTTTSSGGGLKYYLDKTTGEHGYFSEDQLKENPGRFARPLFAAQQAELTRLDSNLSGMKDLKETFKAVTDKVGPARYPLNELYRRIPGLEADPAFRAFQQMITSLSNEEIKRITGAQMSEPEAERLKKGMANGSLKLDELVTAIYLMERGMQRNRAGLVGGLKEWEAANPYKLPDVGTAAPGKGSKLSPEEEELLKAYQSSPGSVQ